MRDFMHSGVFYLSENPDDKGERIMAKFLACLGVLMFAAAASADTIKLKNGNTLEGVILKDDPDGVIIRLKFGTTTLLHSEIESIGRTTPAPGTKAPRLAPWGKCYEVLAARPWGSELRPSPATVIDTGLLKYVPYISSRGGDREFNIYGDPERPADLEVGISGGLLKLDKAKTDCLDLLATLLCDSKDAEFLRTLDLRKAKDKKEAAGLVFQFEQEEDSEGNPTWWLSVYDPKALDSARLSEKDLEARTQPPPEKSPGSTTTTTSPPAPTAAAPKPPDPSTTTSTTPSPDNGRGGSGRRRYSRGRSYRPHMPKGGNSPGKPAPGASPK
jgi:hypothetical protein